MRLSPHYYNDFKLANRLRFPGTAMPAPVLIAQAGNFFKAKLRLVLHNPELADPIIDADMRIAQGIRRHKPLVVIATIRTIHHALMISLNNPEVLFMCEHHFLSEDRSVEIFKGYFERLKKYGEYISYQAWEKTIGFSNVRETILYLFEEAKKEKILSSHLSNAITLLSFYARC